MAYTVSLGLIRRRQGHVEASERRSERSTGFRILDLDPVVDELVIEARRLIANPPVPFPELTMARYLVATAFEDAVDVASEDEATARMILNQAITQTLHYLFLRNESYIPRQKDLIERVSAIDGAIGALVHRYFSAAPLSEALAVGQEIVDRIAGSHGFFERESEAERLTDDEAERPGEDGG